MYFNIMYLGKDFEPSLGKSTWNVLKLDTYFICLEFQRVLCENVRHRKSYFLDTAEHVNRVAFSILLKSEILFRHF